MCLVYMCVCAFACVFVCTCLYVWRPEADVKDSSLITFYPCSLRHSLLTEPRAQRGGYSGWPVCSVSAFQGLELQAGCSESLTFTWILGIGTLVLTFVRQALYPLSFLLSHVVDFGHSVPRTTEGTPQTRVSCACSIDTPIRPPGPAKAQTVVPWAQPSLGCRVGKGHLS